MKAKLKVLMLGLILSGMSVGILKAQGVEFSAGMDLYSKYLWRGLSFGNGAQFQPTVSASVGGLTIGAWGSFDVGAFGAGPAYTETDLFVSYATEFGLTATVTDYSTGTAYFTTIGDTIQDHAFEVAASYELGKLSITGAYIINSAPLPGTIGGDTYVELAYSFLESTSLAIGAGNGWYTKDEKFMLCNVALKTTKELKFSETYSLPVTGILMLNPSTEMFTVGVGLTF